MEISKTHKITKSQAPFEPFDSLAAAILVLVKATLNCCFQRSILDRSTNINMFYNLYYKIYQSWSKSVTCHDVICDFRRDLLHHFPVNEKKKKTGTILNPKAFIDYFKGTFVALYFLNVMTKSFLRVTSGNNDNFNWESIA